MQEVSIVPAVRDKFIVCDHKDLAIISTHPLEFVYSEDMFIVAETELFDIPIRVFSVHLPCGISHQSLMEVARRILRFATTDVILLAGDLNLDPKRPKDKSLFSVFRGVLAHTNLTWFKNLCNTRFPEAPEHSAHILDHFFLSIP